MPSTRVISPGMVLYIVIKCGVVCYHMYPTRILTYPVCIPMYFAVFRWIHKNGRILMSPMCIPKIRF
jgi:hypothetical protein